MSYQGDYAEDYATLNFKFTSRQFSTGAPYTLAGSPSLAVYPVGSTTEITAGITLSVDYDSVTGLNDVVIDLSASASYVTGKDYEVVIAAGSVDSVSVVGEVVGSFSIENRTTLPKADYPANFSDLSVTSSTGLVSVGSLASNVITAASSASDFIAEIQAAITGGAYVLDTDSNGRIRLVDGTGAGEIDLTSGTVLLSAATEAQIDAIETDTAEIGTAGAGLSAIPWNAAWDAEVQSEAADALAAFWTSPATLVDLVWDEVLSGHLTSGTTGAGLNAAGSAGDPWSTSLPGAYGAGTAGFILGTYLDEAISGLNDLSQADIRSAVGLSSANLDTQLDALPTAAENRAEMDSNSTKLASILADTNELQTDDVPGLIAALNDLSQAEVTGGAYSLDTDGNGRIRVVDGTGAGEISLTGGLIDGIAGTKNTLDDLNDPTVASILTTQMTESYAADGTAPTLSQALFLIQQVLTEFAIVGTTLTVNKLDGSTSAASLTLDDASNPTSLTRAA